MWKIIAKPLKMVPKVDTDTQKMRTRASQNFPKIRPKTFQSQSRIPSSDHRNKKHESTSQRPPLKPDFQRNPESFGSQKSCLGGPKAFPRWCRFLKRSGWDSYRFLTIFRMAKKCKLRYSCGRDAIFVLFVYVEVSCANIFKFGARGPWKSKL